LCDQIALIVHWRIVAIGTAAELEAGVGRGAHLDDVFNKLVGIESESEAVKSYAEVRRDATLAGTVEPPNAQRLRDYATQVLRSRGCRRHKTSPRPVGAF
jgi:hypothetical protein